MDNKKIKWIPELGQRFWHKEYNEYCWLEKILPTGIYVCCLHPRRNKDDDYYGYNKKELTRADESKK
jgi:hypothetical protein